jgi:hypothetical protein
MQKAELQAFRRLRRSFRVILLLSARLLLADGP